ncbi:hypothetical protein [Marinomonas sp.]
MSIFGTLLNGITGGFAEKAIDAVKEYFPPDMSAEQKAEMQLKLKQIELDAQRQANTAVNEAEKVLNQRIAEYEGTASDLKAIPVVGPLMIFLRGLQRPVWGFATLYMDFMWFAEWTTLTEKQESALMAINVLVLGFLFGERAVKNVMPLITKLFEAKRG